MISRAAILLFLCLAATTTMATDNYFVSQRKEASMLVTGTVHINPDGSVMNYTLDHPEELDSSVKELVDQNVKRWNFQFASAPSATATENLSVRLVARMLDDRHVSLRIAGVSFDDAEVPEDENIRYDKKHGADFPKAAFEEGVWGTAYVLLRVGRDGRVQEASVEQVDLGTFAPTADMARYRKYLGDAAVKGIRQSTFKVPTKGKNADQPYWLVRIPVNFLNPNDPEPVAYGAWQTYVPGPRADVSWLDHPELAAGAPDAVPDGMLHALQGEPQLRTGTSGG